MEAIAIRLEAIATRLEAIAQELGGLTWFAEALDAVARDAGDRVGGHRAGAGGVAIPVGLGAPKALEEVVETWWKLTRKFLSKSKQILYDSPMHYALSLMLLLFGGVLSSKIMASQVREVEVSLFGNPN